MVETGSPTVEVGRRRSRLTWVRVFEKLILRILLVMSRRNCNVLTIVLIVTNAP